jgi:hypothetical protein
MVAAAALLSLTSAQATAANPPQASGIAFLGEPFGVGQLEVELPPSSWPPALGRSGVGIGDAHERVLYPAIERRPLAQGLRRFSQLVPKLGGRLGNVLDRATGIAGRVGESIERSGRVTIYFLFSGSAPLEVAVQSRQSDIVHLTPIADPAAHRQVLAAWWRQYSQSSGGLWSNADYPPLVEDYLRAMLARRLQLPLARRPARDSWQDQLVQGLDLMTGTESIRVSIQRDRVLGAPGLQETADQPLPEPLQPPPPNFPKLAAAPELEPLAQGVPRECFYVRFGTFANFLWLQDLLAQWGGDLQNLAAERGLDRGVRKRIETQLALRTGPLARLLGPSVVADVALVGTDMFFADGGAYGLLFLARTNLLLGADLARQRAERLARNDGAAEVTVKIDGHPVSRLSSPDGSLRSYYVADGDYHFVTTSEALVRRFLQSRAGGDSLAGTEEFRAARAEMPLARQDTIFIYLSDAFFRNFTGPQYRIETLRRLQALADLELAELAKLAAQAERKPAETLAQLVAGDFLPPEFGLRPDGSLAIMSHGEPCDSLRGHRGWFAPVPDVPVGRVTPSEAAEYGRFAEHYQRQWGRLDPVLIGIHREALPAQRERILLDVKLTPLARQHYEMAAGRFGPPEREQLAPAANDAMAFDAVLPGGRLFGGIQGLRAPADIAGQTRLPLSWLGHLLVGYLGAAGQPGPLLELLNLRMRTFPDAEGYAVSDGGLWRRQTGPYTVFSYQHDVLTAVTNQLRLVPAARPAQLWLRIGDLSDARAVPWANDLGYLRTRETSLGNLRLLHAMTQQLHVAGPAARAAAESVLGARLIDPLGGDYVFRPGPAGAGYWTSTVLEGSSGESDSPRPPQGYQAPPLSWFRGLNADARFAPDALSAHAEVIMQLPETIPAVPAGQAR